MYNHTIKFSYLLICNYLRVFGLLIYINIYYNIFRARQSSLKTKTTLDGATQPLMRRARRQNPGLPGEGPFRTGRGSLEEESRRRLPGKGRQESVGLENTKTLQRTACAVREATRYHEPGNTGATIFKTWRGAPDDER